MHQKESGRINMMNKITRYTKTLKQWIYSQSTHRQKLWSISATTPWRIRVYQKQIDKKITRLSITWYCRLERQDWYSSLWLAGHVSHVSTILVKMINLLLKVLMDRWKRRTDRCVCEISSLSEFWTDWNWKKASYIIYVERLVFSSRDKLSLTRNLWRNFRRILEMSTVCALRWWDLPRWK